MVNSGLGSGILPTRHQVITRTNDEYLEIGFNEANFSGNYIKIIYFSFMEMNFKMSLTLFKKKPIMILLEFHFNQTTQPDFAYIR